MAWSDGIAAAVFVIVVSAIHWRTTIKVVIFLSVFEGAFRKWVFPEANHLVYFVKDLMLLGAYVAAVFDRSRERSWHSRAGLRTSLWLSCGVVALQCLNPNQGSLLAGIFGVKIYLWYMPLLWLLPDAFRDKLSFLRFLRAFLALAIPVGVLGILQFRAPLDSALNIYSQAVGQVIGFGEDSARPQITGSFSFISGYTSFLLFAFSIWICFTVGMSKAFDCAVQILILVLLVGNMLMTGSRKTLTFVGLTVAMMTAAFFGQRPAVLLTKPSVIFFAAIGLVTGGVLFRDAIEAFSYRARNADDLQERIGWLARPFAALLEADWIGHGAGVTHPARQYVEAELGLPEPGRTPPGMDFEPDQILTELGSPGFLVWYSLKLSLLVALVRTRCGLKDLQLKMLATGAVTFHIAHLYLSTVLNHTAHLYFWFMAGFIGLLPKLDAAPAAMSLDNEGVETLCTAPDARASRDWKIWSGSVGS